MSLANIYERATLYELGPARTLEQLANGALDLDVLRSLSALEWGITHRKQLSSGTSVLRYAVTGERAVRLVDKVQHLRPETEIVLLGQNTSRLSLELDLGQDGLIQIEVMFDPTATVEYTV